MMHIDDGPAFFLAEANQRIGVERSPGGRRFARFADIGRLGREEVDASAVALGLGDAFGDILLKFRQPLLASSGVVAAIIEEDDRCRVASRNCMVLGQTPILVDELPTQATRSFSLNGNSIGLASGVCPAARGNASANATKEAMIFAIERP